MPRIKQKRVHFIFTRHEPSNPYVRHRNTPLPKTKTFVYECALGNPPTKNTDFREFTKLYEGTRHRTEMNTFVKNALDRSIRVVPGEQGTQKQISTLNEMNRQINARVEEFNNKRSFEKFKKVVHAIAHMSNFREQLIIRTITSHAFDGHVEAHFGATHSTLRQKLKKKGINSSAELNSHLFRFADAVVRKLTLSKKPSELEYKQAFIAGIISDKLRELLGAQSIPFLKSPTNNAYTFYVKVENTLIRKLTEPQINSIIEHCVKTNSENFAFFKVAQFTGLQTSDKPKPKEFRKAAAEFLNKNKAYWRQTKRSV